MSGRAAPPLTGGITARREPGAIGVPSPAYSSSTAINAVGSKGAKAGSRSAKAARRSATVEPACQLDRRPRTARPAPWPGRRAERSLPFCVARLQSAFSAVLPVLAGRRACRGRRTISGCETASSTTRWLCWATSALTPDAGGKRLDSRRRSSTAGRSDDRAGRRKLGITMRSGMAGGVFDEPGDELRRDSGTIAGRRAGRCRGLRLRASRSSPSSIESRISAGRVCGTTTSAPRLARRRRRWPVPRRHRPAARPRPRARPRPLRSAVTTRPITVWPSNSKSSLGRPIRSLEPAAGTMAAIMGSRRRHRHEGRPGSRSRGTRREHGRSRLAGPGCAGRSARPRC